MKTKSDKFKNIFKIYEFKNRHIVFNIFGIKIKFIIDKKYKKYRSLPSIKYLEVHLCDHCNLKCKLCSHYCNLVQSEIFTDLKQYKKDINELAKKLNIKTIRLMGGEPLLNPDIEEFFKVFKEALIACNVSIPIKYNKEKQWKTQ